MSLNGEGEHLPLISQTSRPSLCPSTSVKLATLLIFIDLSKRRKIFDGELFQNYGLISTMSERQNHLSDVSIEHVSVIYCTFC